MVKTNNYQTFVFLLVRTLFSSMPQIFIVFFVVVVVVCIFANPLSDVELVKKFLSHSVICLSILEPTLLEELVKFTYSPHFGSKGTEAQSTYLAC